MKSLKNIFVAKKSEATMLIESKMREEQKKMKRTLRILLLGPGDSGKTTVVKQMKKIHNNLSVNEISMMSSYIQEAVISYAKTLAYQSCVLHDKCDEKTLVSDEIEEIRVRILGLESPYKITSQLAHSISKLWSDPGIKHTSTLRSHFQIHDNVSYFLDDCNRVLKADYVPSFSDFIRIRVRSTGFTQEHINAEISKFGAFELEFTDVGGQRSERKKWMKIVADNIHAVLFVVAISEYDLVCFEDNTTNRLTEALTLFKQVINGKFFDQKSVVLFFNKYDLFQEKICKVPITVAFNDFDPNTMGDPKNADDVIQFIAKKFMACFDGKNVELTAPLHIHRTTALDTDNMEKVFHDITVDLIKLNFQNMNVL